MKVKPYECIPSALAVLAAAGVMTVFRACSAGEDGMWMNCHSAQMIVFYISIVNIVLSIAGILVKNWKLRLGLGILGILLACASALVPGVIVHLCMMNTMRCHALMRPFAVVMGILYAGFGCLKFFLDRRRERVS